MGQSLVGEAISDAVVGEDLTEKVAFPWDP